MQLGIFVFDFSWLEVAASLSVLQWMGIVLALGGWLLLAKPLLFVFFHLYEDLKVDLNVHHWKNVLLAIDIPALNVQTPKAVEQMFSQLAGAFHEPDLKDRLKDGYKQRWFSFEIISIEGYIQFLVWTEEAFRDLVEASVYAQYPDATVVEVEDYVNSVPDKYPNPETDVWISDFGLAENDAYPIRSYREFEHAISKDTVLKDPMGTFLESFSRLGPGEQMWFQILVEPISNHWKEEAIHKIKEVIGEKPHAADDHLGDKFTRASMKFLERVGDEVFNREAGEADGHDAHDGPPNQLQYMTPGMSKLVEAMELKMAKMGLKTKIRGAYLAPKTIFNPRRGINAMVGALNQYNIPSANSIVPTYGGTGNSKKSQKKKNVLIKAYKKRKMSAGGKTCVLNIEELATIWHFPMSHVKTPNVQKSASKQAEPPMGLPLERIMPILPVVESSDPRDFSDSQGSDGRTFTTDSGDVVRYDS